MFDAILLDGRRILACCVAIALVAPGSGPVWAQSRRPTDEASLRRWLEIMVWDHQFDREEIREATGLAADEIDAALDRFQINRSNRPAISRDRIRVVPYPGGRHPRIGFLDGAVNPQRETKLSVFTPWDDSSYVVLDVPEAIWSNLGLTYLAHTHVPTIWDEQRVSLEVLEWQVSPDGVYTSQRRLPNGIEFGCRVEPKRDAVVMWMWLTNHSQAKLSDLRVQNCVMLKGAKGFDAQTNDNKIVTGAYALCHSADRQRWIITAWDPLHRNWGNPPCPCLHSDPVFGDCDVGQTQWLRGWLSFYEGADIDAELRRIEATGWRRARSPDK